MSSKVASGALFHARQRKAERIFCGHTHEAMHLERDGCHYYNAGGWVDASSTYVTIDGEGVRIREYQATNDPDDESTNRGGLAGQDDVFDDAEYENVAQLS